MGVPNGLAHDMRGEGWRFFTAEAVSSLSADRAIPLHAAWTRTHVVPGQAPTGVEVSAGYRGLTPTPVHRRRFSAGMAYRPRAMASVRQLASGRWQLRVDMGRDPLTGTRRWATKTVEATGKREARFLTLLSDGERLTGAYALGPEAGEGLQQATLAIRPRVLLEVRRDTMQPFPTFSELYVAALKALRREITAAGQPAGQEEGVGAST